MLQRPSDLFGIPFRLDRHDAAALRDELASAWETQYGPRRSLARDLQRMYERLFRPTAREGSLRRAIEHDVQAAPSASLPAELRVDVGSGQLISPEGRLVLDVLDDALTNQDGTDVTVSLDVAAGAEHLLLDVYRGWARQRLNKVVELTAGSEAPLLPAPIGLVLMLLVEGAIGRTRALTQRRTGHVGTDERPITEAIAAFAQTLEPNADWDMEHFALYRGYALSEARRRLSAVVLEPPHQRRGPDSPPKRLFITEGAEAATITFLAADLERRGATRTEVETAFDAMMAAHAAAADRIRAERAGRRALAIREQLLSAMSG